MTTVRLVARRRDLSQQKERPEEAARCREDFLARGEPFAPDDEIDTHGGREEAGGNVDPGRYPVLLLRGAVVSAADGAFDFTFESMAALRAPRDAECFVEFIGVHADSIHGIRERTAGPFGTLRVTEERGKRCVSF